MFTITYEGGRCTSAPFDKTIFHGMDNTIVLVISYHTDVTTCNDTKYVTACVAACRYISKTIERDVYPCGFSDYHEAPDSIAITLHIQFHEFIDLEPTY